MDYFVRTTLCWIGQRIPPPVRSSGVQAWSSPVTTAAEWLLTVNRLGPAKDRIRSGVRTSREIFFWATVGVVTRSRSATTSLAICFCVVPWSTPATRRSDPGWSGRFGNMGCLRRFVAITGCRLLLWHWAASASSRSGGFSSGSGRSALSPLSQAKTDATNGCTERSSTMLHHKKDPATPATLFRSVFGGIQLATFA